MLLLKLLTAMGVRNNIPILIMFGALTGAVAFSVVSRRPGTLVTGALAGAMGLTLTCVVSWAAWEIWPQRLTELEPAVFATLIALTRFCPCLSVSGCGATLVEESDGIASIGINLKFVIEIP